MPSCSIEQDKIAFLAERQEAIDDYEPVSGSSVSIICPATILQHFAVEGKWRVAFLMAAFFKRSEGGPYSVLLGLGEGLAIAICHFY